MKLRRSKKRNQAMDIMDILVLIAIIVILGTMIILSLKRVHSRANPAFGPENFKQAKLSYHILEGGNDTRYPMAISAAAPPEFRNGTMNVNSACKYP